MTLFNGFWLSELQLTILPFLFTKEILHNKSDFNQPKRILFSIVSLVGLGSFFNSNGKIRFLVLLDVQVGNSRLLLYKQRYSFQNKVRSYLSRYFENLQICNLFVTSKNKFSNSPIHDFKVLQNVFKIKKQGLKCFLK